MRGVPLNVRLENTLERLLRVREQTDLITPAIEDAWQAALAAPESSERRWLHGDLHAQNVLVSESGEICAVIDWGDLAGGDVATDLAGIWALFDSADARAAAVASLRSGFRPARSCPRLGRSVRCGAGGFRADQQPEACGSWPESVAETGIRSNVQNLGNG